MISPTDAGGSFIAHDATKGLPDQAEISPDASEICLSTDGEALSSGWGGADRREEKQSTRPPSSTPPLKQAGTYGQKMVKSGEGGRLET